MCPIHLQAVTPLSLQGCPMRAPPTDSSNTQTMARLSSAHIPGRSQVWVLFGFLCLIRFSAHLQASVFMVIRPSSHKLTDPTTVNLGGSQKGNPWVYTIKCQQIHSWIFRSCMTSASSVLLWQISSVNTVYTVTCGKDNLLKHILLLFFRKSRYEDYKECEQHLNTKQAGTSCVSFSNLGEEDNPLVLVENLVSTSEEDLVMLLLNILPYVCRTLCVSNADSLQEVIGRIPDIVEMELLFCCHL